MMFKLQERLVFQVLIIQYLNIIAIIFTGKTKAHEFSKDNKIELFNEWFVTVAGMHVILFSDFAPDQEA